MIDGNDAAPTAANNEVSLAARPVAYSVISELLRVQDDVEPRGALRRILGVSPLHVDAESWFFGAHGELKVGALLSKLGDEWTVLHAVPVGTGTATLTTYSWGLLEFSRSTRNATAERRSGSASEC